MSSVLTLFARLTGRIWFFYWTTDGKRHIHFGKP